MYVAGCGKIKADIVFLVDESWSIGSDNFGKVKDFLFRVVTYFPAIGPQGTQVTNSLSIKTSAELQKVQLLEFVFIITALVSKRC